MPVYSETTNTQATWVGKSLSSLNILIDNLTDLPESALKTMLKIEENPLKIKAINLVLKGL